MQLQFGELGLSRIRPCVYSLLSMAEPSIHLLYFDCEIFVFICIQTRRYFYMGWANGWDRCSCRSVALSLSLLSCLFAPFLLLLHTHKSNWCFAPTTQTRHVGVDKANVRKTNSFLVGRFGYECQCGVFPNRPSTISLHKMTLGPTLLLW